MKTDGKTQRKTRQEQPLPGMLWLAAFIFLMRSQEIHLLDLWTPAMSPTLNIQCKVKMKPHHLLKAAEVCIGMKWFVRKANVPTGVKKWKIFTSEEDYESYVEFKKPK